MLFRSHKKGLMVTKGLQEGLEEIITIPSEFTEDERKELLDVASHFCGRVVNIGCHASAVLVTPDAVENYCPIEGAKSAAKNTQGLLDTNTIRLKRWES